ncbi:hypothetical protein JG688_00007299, partial [Phytophthora aleatoria]
VWQVDAYLADVVVAPTEPAILLDWNRDNVAHIVQAANAAGRPQDPPWLTRNGQGRITVNSFVNDIMRELKARDGGRWGKVCVAPNSIVQAGGVPW